MILKKGREILGGQESSELTSQKMKKRGYHENTL